MAQTDQQTLSTDEQLAQLRQGEADLKTAIGAAGDRVIAKLDAFQAKLDQQPLTAPASLDLSQDIQEMRNDMVLLGSIAPADAATVPAAPVTVPVTVGSTIGVPADPTDPNSPTLDHTVTNIGADGSITAEPVEGAEPVPAQDSADEQTSTDGQASETT